MKLVKPVDNLPWPLIQRDRNLVHFPILKNGHSSITDWLKGRDLGFETLIVDVPPDALSFAVIRHPYDRYISAVAQMWRMGIVADVPWRDFVDGVEAFNVRTATPWTCRGDRHFIAQARTVGRMTDNRHLFHLANLSPMYEMLERHGLSTTVELDQQKPTTRAMLDYAHRRLTRGVIEREYAADLALYSAIA